MPKQQFNFKRFYATFLTIDVIIWFAIVPVVISMHLTGAFLTLHAPTIQEYIVWQVLGFVVTWIALHISYHLGPKKKR